MTSPTNPGSPSLSTRSLSPSTRSLSPSKGRRWLGVLGVLLLPVLLGGILVGALYNPTERLSNISAAIVNDDEPVTIDGQLVPLGRQLTAGLVEGSDEIPSNVDWTISNTDDAESGLADGTYTAVVTIPSGFSAAATSTAPGGTPTRATIDVKTAPDARVVDDAITAQITQAAASILGTQLSATYLDNVFLGFTTLGDQLGEAASGARQLADGAGQAADGAAQLPAGASGIADGAGQLANGAGQLASGLDQLAAGARQSQGGASQLSSGAAQGAATLRQNGLVPSELVDGAAGVATGAGAVSGAIDGLVAPLQRVRDAVCTADPASQTCIDAATALGTVQGVQAPAAQTAQGAQGVSGGLSQFASAAPQSLAAQFDQIAGGAGQLASGLGQVAGGIDQSAAGARDLSSGASQLSSGAGQLATGAQSLADGVARLATGTGDLATGLQTAVDQIPSYSDDEARSLADVVADPVAATGNPDGLFGVAAIPLLAVLVLWVGGIGTFVALRATPARVLASRAPSVVLALRAFAPAAAIGAGQGLLVAAVVQFAASYDAQTWAGFALVCLAAGIAFAAVNQALVAVLRGTGRWIAALVAVLAVATGVVSTVPGVLAQLASLLPTAPASRAMLATLTEAGGLGGAVAALGVWTVLSLVATTVAVARGRTTSVAALRAASAPA